MKAWKKSLLFELVGYYLLASIATVSCVGYVAYRVAREALRESVFDKLRTVASLPTIRREMQSSRQTKPDNLREILVSINDIRTGLANLSISNRINVVFVSTGKSEIWKSGETYLVGDIGAQFEKKYAFVRSDSFDTGGFESGLKLSAIDAAMQGKGAEVMGVYRRLEKHDLALLVEVGTEEAFAPARRLARSILLIGLLSAAVLGAFVAFVARKITRPVVRLTATV